MISQAEMTGWSRDASCIWEGRGGRGGVLSHTAFMGLASGH